MRDRIYFLAAVLLALIMCLIKNEVTARARIKIVNAIFLYGNVNQDVSFGEITQLVSHMETYNETLFRSWDWGCKNILPKEDYLKIKPYIRRRGKKCFKKP